MLLDVLLRSHGRISLALEPILGSGVIQPAAPRIDPIAIVNTWIRVRAS